MDRDMLLDSENEIVSSMPMAPSGSARLDFLRSCAVLSVVCSHLWFAHAPIAKFGRFGVLLFFVHTSLVLMFSLERQVARHGTRRLWSAFMLRRVFRIFPLCLVVLTVIFLLRIPGYVVGDGVVYDFHPDPLGFAFNLLLVQEVFVSKHWFGSMIGVLWTLPIEMQMYLFLPVIFHFVRRVTDARILVGLWVLSAIGAYGVTALLGRVTTNRVLVTFDWGWIAWPRLIEFAPYFLGGVLAYALWRRGTRTLPFWAFACYLGAMAGAYLVMLEAQWPGRVLVWGSMIGIGLGLGLLLPAVREPVSRPLASACASVARYSFSIYLIHVPCIWFGFQVLNRQPAIVQWAAFLGALAGVSWMLYHLVERPGIALGQRLVQQLLSPAHRPIPLDSGTL
jgi:peptidoglycan/LPS O-acetylase OafA/YrhL